MAKTNYIGIRYNKSEDEYSLTELKLQNPVNIHSEEIRYAIIDKIEKENSCKLTQDAIESMVLIDRNTEHFCPYCSEPAPGNYHDLLCEDCKMLFGHSLGSEL